jgi:hypothetical protein
VGFEINPEYFAMVKRRIARSVEQPARAATVPSAGASVLS